MKLDVVAVDIAVVGEDEQRRGRIAKAFGHVLLTSVAAGCLLWAGAGLALDGIDLSRPAEATPEGECPKLIQIKYPWVSCAAGEIGLSDSRATWANERQIPMGSDFVEGNGYWGDDLNQD